MTVAADQKNRWRALYKLQRGWNKNQTKFSDDQPSIHKRESRHNMKLIYDDFCLVSSCFLCLCADVWLKGTVNVSQHRLLATERVIGLGASNQVPSFSAAPWCSGWRSLRYVVENKSSADEVGLLSSLAPIQYYSSPISLLASIYSALSLSSYRYTLRAE